MPRTLRRVTGTATSPCPAPEHSSAETEEYTVFFEDAHGQPMMTAPTADRRAARRAYTAARAVDPAALFATSTVTVQRSQWQATA